MDAILVTNRGDLRCRLPREARAAFYCDNLHLHFHGYLVGGNEMVDHMTIEEAERLATNPYALVNSRIGRHALVNQLVATMGQLEIVKAMPLVQPYHCDGERIIAWLDDPKRKDARLAFTAGLERQIAYRFEDATHREAEWSVAAMKLELENRRLRETLDKTGQGVQE